MNFSSSLLLLVAVVGLAQGKISEDYVYEEHTQFVFVDRFCFDKEGGEVIFKVDRSDKEHHKNTKLLLFHDLPGSGGFESIYKKTTSCEAKVAMAQDSAVFDIDHPEGMKKWRVLEGMRAHWWYAAFVNCDQKDPGWTERVAVPRYQITFENNNKSIFRRHFSHDEQGIYESDIVLFVLLTIGVCLFLHTYKKIASETNHPTKHVMKFLTIITAINLFNKILQLIERGEYSRNGIAPDKLHELTLFIDLIPQTLLIALFVAVAQGWMISADKVRDIRGIAEVTFGYFVLLVVLFAWSFSFDPAEVLYVYSSAPGICVVIARIILFAWFLTGIIETSWVEADQSKRCFFLSFGGFGAFWFLSLPLTVMLAQGLDDWNRRKVVEILGGWITVISYFVIWAIFRSASSYIVHSSGDKGNARVLSSSA